LKINDILKNKIKKIELSDGFKKYFVNTGWLFLIQAGYSLKELLEWL